MYEHIIIYISRIETIKSNNLHYSYKTTQIKHRRHNFGLLKKITDVDWIARDLYKGISIKKIKTPNKPIRHLPTALYITI